MKMEYAKYVGTADIRLMLERDWKAAGIENQETVEWSATNGFAVPRKRFSDDAWAVVANDPTMVVTGERPSAPEVAEAEVRAAVNRLRARQAGMPVLHKQDEIPAVDGGGTPGAKVQGSKATSNPGTPGVKTAKA